MGSLHIDDLLHSTSNIGWANVVGCRDSYGIDLDLHILHVGCRTGAHIDDLRILIILIVLRMVSLIIVLRDYVCLVDCLVVLSIFQV